MTLTEKEQLLDQLTVLADYYEKPKSPATLAIYLQQLDDLPYAAIVRALEEHVNTGFPSFPKVTDIRQLLQGDSDTEAELAWHELVREIRRTGYYNQPRLPAATMDAVERMWGSWVTLCQTLPADGPEFLGWAKRFRETYAAMATRERLALPSPNRPQLGTSRALVADGDTP